SFVTTCAHSRLGCSAERMVSMAVTRMASAPPCACCGAPGRDARGADRPAYRFRSAHGCGPTVFDKANFACADKPELRWERLGTASSQLFARGQAGVQDDLPGASAFVAAAEQ